MRSSCLALLTLLFSVYSNTQAYGFNALGHMVIAQIADEQLSPQVRQQVEHLVDLYTPLYPTTDSFVAAAPWMDDLKRLNIDAYHEWHYISLPYLPGQSDFSADISPTNIVWAIDLMLAQLNNPETSCYQRAGALRMLIHLVGDLHQPLHAISRYDPRTKRHDAGGNGFALNDPRYSNLHRFWDAGLGLFDGANIYRPLLSADKAGIAAIAGQLATDVKLDEVDITWPVDIQAWADESYYLATTIAYTDIEPNTQPSIAYVQRGTFVVKSQIVLAGMRLGALLNEIFQD